MSISLIISDVNLSSSTLEMMYLISNLRYFNWKALIILASRGCNLDFVFLGRNSTVYLVVDELRPCVLWARWFCWRFFGMVSMVLLIGSWCYSREWVWNLRTKLRGIASGKWNISRVSLQGFDITYIIL